MELMAGDFSSKFCCTVFHADKPAEKPHEYIREFCVKSITSIIPFETLDTPTVFIKNIEEVKKFLKDSPEFILDPKGYDPEHNRSNNEYDRNKANPQGWRYSTIGIWASSYTAYKNFLKSEYDYLLIFEDDMLIQNDFMDVFTTHFSELPDGWDVYYHFNAGSPRLAKKITEHLARPNQMWSNAAYVMSRKGAEKAVQSVETAPGAYLPIDWHFLKQLNIFDIYTSQQNKYSACRLARVASSYHGLEEYKDLTGLL